MRSAASGLSTQTQGDAVGTLRRVMRQHLVQGVEMGRSAPLDGLG
jgi:hypothetical protein